MTVIMFTGIIETLGTITHVKRLDTAVQLIVKPDKQDFPVAIGGSVAIDGICLTLEKHAGSALQFCAVAETLSKTTLAAASVGRRVNLERALIAGGRLDGHFVYGHVDGCGTILDDRSAGGGSIVKTITIPSGLAQFIALKGSVAIDGISLTISSCDASTFEISLIPHTLAQTTLATKKRGDLVNIEVDIIVRYLSRLQSGNALCTPEVSRDQSLLNVMERSGF
jgi:riboflavin synthase